MTATLEREAAIAAVLERRVQAATLAREASLAARVERQAAEQAWVDREFRAITGHLYAKPSWLEDGVELTVTDLFCGAGGSSSGLESVPGIRVVMAVNHSAVALETHQHNFPHVDHDRQDVHEADPRRYPTTDILWASPSCTFFSQASGRPLDFTDQATDPTLFDLDVFDDEDDEPLPEDTAERSRALMHDVPRFAEHHRYRAVIVENTLPLLRWKHLPKLIARMRNLGYRHKVLTLNSAFAHQLGRPAPQLRNRVYIVFWLDKYKAPDFDRWTRPRAWCPTCDEVVRAIYAPKNPKNPYGSYGAQYVYRCPRVSCRNAIVAPFTLPAISALDLSVPADPIGDRLVPGTRARIAKWLQTNPRPVDLGRGGSHHQLNPMAVIPLRNHNVAKHPMEPLDTFAARGTHHAIAMLMRTKTPAANPGNALWNPDYLYAYDTGRLRSAYQPLPTQTTVEGDAVLEQRPSLEECLFRMLMVDEIKLGMAFPPTFALLGRTKALNVRLCGNAVTPNVARDLVAAVAEAITGNEVPVPA
ncbi:DNA cytosine methyltransferase [Actinophytocola sp.]|uniref:DNA cytosine methyltransferase n=1 Tax=Actinophytocola sp. TaxID=1872138 RepID=UPI002ED1640B